MKNIIIDTDPGVDDALAIALACKSRNLKVEALTTVYGNVSIENTTKNALTILEILKQKILVYKGSDGPIKNRGKLAKSHGANGLGGFEMIINTKAEDLSVADFFIRKLKATKKKKTVVCLGPATNLVMTKRRYSDLDKDIDEIVILGGVFGERGNISRKAEFNVFNDPLALSEVLEFRCKKVLIPINICRRVVFNKEDFDKLKNDGERSFFNKITRMYIDYYTKDKKYGRFAGGVMYDLLAIVYLVKPELFRLEEKFVKIEMDDRRENYGETSFTSDNGCNCNVVVGVDELGVKDLFFKVMNQ